MRGGDVAHLQQVNVPEWVDLLVQTKEHDIKEFGAVFSRNLDMDKTTIRWA